MSHHLPCRKCGGDHPEKSCPGTRMGPIARGTQFIRTGCDFVTWYAATAADDASMIWEKAKQYGGFNLQAHGLALLRGDTQQNLEPALAFNALQKVSRIVEALGHGQIVSLDSWRDLAAYAMIARRLREAKTWPA